MRKVCSFRQKKALRQRFTGFPCRKPSTGRGEGQGWSIKCQGWGNNICSTTLNFAKDFGILLQYWSFYWLFLGLESWNKMQHCFSPHVKHWKHLVFWQSHWAGVLSSKYALAFLCSQNGNFASGQHFPLSYFPWILRIHAWAAAWPMFWPNGFWVCSVVSWLLPQSQPPMRKFIEKNSSFPRTQDILSLKA